MVTSSFTIPTPKGPRTIGPGQPCFIIAEMSANHQQNFEKAVSIIHAAAKAGADAIKLQTYTPEGMTIDCDKEWFHAGGQGNPALWSKETLFTIYQKAHTPREWHPQLKKIAESLGLVFFSTPFDPSAVDFLEQLDIPLYKIASYEVTDIPLLKRVAQTKKPIILSVGFASREEIDLAVATLRQGGSKDIALLHCVTAYSRKPNESEINLQTILEFRDRYGVVVGFSDNNAGQDIPLQAAAMGASIIEKHVVASDQETTFDADFSLDPEELANLVTAIRRQETIRGVINYGVQGKAEEHNLRYRKSIFVVKDIGKGEPFTAENIRVIRPSFGLPSKYLPQILGKKAAIDIERGTPLSFDHVEGGQQKEIHLRPAEQFDKEDLFRWRNDPGTVRISPSGPVSTEEHLAWFKKKLKDPSTTLLIVLNEHYKPVGMIRFDQSSDNSDGQKEMAEISLNLDPAYRRQGYGKMALQAALQQYLSRFPQTGITARIMPANEISQGLFSSLGFVPTEKILADGTALFILPLSAFSSSPLHLSPIPSSTIPSSPVSSSIASSSTIPSSPVSSFSTLSGGNDGHP